MLHYLLLVRQSAALTIVESTVFFLSLLAIEGSTVAIELTHISPLELGRE